MRFREALVSPIEQRRQLVSYCVRAAAALDDPDGWRREKLAEALLWISLALVGIVSLDVDEKARAMAEEICRGVLRDRTAAS